MEDTVEMCIRDRYPSDKNTINYLKTIKNNQFPININGLSESGKAYAIWSLFESSEDSIVIFTSSDMESKKLYEELSFFTTNAYYFPTKDIVFYNITAISGDLIWERLKAVSYTHLDVYKRQLLSTNILHNLSLKIFSLALLMVSTCKSILFPSASCKMCIRDSHSS